MKAELLCKGQSRSAQGAVSVCLERARGGWLCATVPPQLQPDFPAHSSELAAHLPLHRATACAAVGCACPREDFGCLQPGQLDEAEAFKIMQRRIWRRKLISPVAVRV